MLIFVISSAGILPTVFISNLTKQIKEDNRRIIQLLEEKKEMESRGQ
ncbi:hypothetical protein H1D32_22925 [Anaerobacillus sp. CMMVII]|nr:hypothetical protein [Anaerobacillus sp. CMMVII]MCT8140298.1 hypothetical protein [Anaerobacillus sp. CMMVII]